MRHRSYNIIHHYTNNFGLFTFTALLDIIWHGFRIIRVFCHNTLCTYLCWLSRLYQNMCYQSKQVSLYCELWVCLVCGVNSASYCQLLADKWQLRDQTPDTAGDGATSSCTRILIGRCWAGGAGQTCELCLASLLVREIFDQQFVSTFNQHHV